MAKTELDFIKKDIENLNTQFNRFTAHLDSEQRVYGGIAKRVDLLEKLFESQQKLIDKLDQIIRNGGAGLQLRVDRIEQREGDNNNRYDRWIGVVGVLIALGSIAMQIINK